MSTYHHLDVSERDGMTIVRFKGHHLLVDVLVINGVGSELDELANGQDRRNGAGLEKGRDFGPVVGRGKGLASGHGGLIA
jgi:hypothetical protein